MERKKFDYINVIPLVDVMLVLLTITLTTSSFIATGLLPIELPKATKSQEKLALKTQTIEIDRASRIYLNSKPVSLSQLKNTLVSLNRESPIFIRADKYISLQTFVNVFDLLKNLGFKKIALQTEEKK
ncbi:MAG: biopolymer transporter ExbD [bacterium]